MAKIELMKITPEIAAEWLADKWPEQRAVRQNYVKRLASDMSTGRWKLSPDALLRVKGKLANGQHRLAAVIASGKSQTFIAMETNDDEIYKVLDAGLRRTVGDGLPQIAYAKSLPSVARWMLGYENKNIRPHTPGGARAAASKKGAVYLTQSVVFDYCLTNMPILSEAAAFVSPLYTQTRILPLSMGAALYALSSNLGFQEAGRDFLVKLYVDGGSNSAGDLRNRLIALRGNRSNTMRPGYLFCLALKALKSYRNGTRPGKLLITADEPMPEL